MNLCDYGCGKKALYKFKNGKCCCSPSRNSCDIIRNNPERKNKISLKMIKNISDVRTKFGKVGKTRIIRREKPEFCDFGCGNPAMFHFNGTDRWCCSKSFNSCKGNKKRNSLSTIGKLHTDDWNRKIGEGNKGKIISKEHIEILRKSVIKSWTIEKREEQRQKMKNGGALKANKGIKKISTEEIKLRKIVQNIYSDCEFQYGVFNYALDIALVNYKIAIEYDGHFHFYTEKAKEYFKKRQKRIEEEGWDFIRYTMFDKFPTKEQVEIDILKALKIFIY